MRICFKAPTCAERGDDRFEYWPSVLVYPKITKGKRAVPHVVIEKPSGEVVETEFSVGSSPSGSGTQAECMVVTRRQNSNKHYAIIVADDDRKRSLEEIAEAFDLSKMARGRLESELEAVLERIGNHALRSLCRDIFEETRSKLTVWPCSATHHHTNVGGLLRHTLEQCLAAERLNPKPSEFRDLLIYRIFIHDLGKIYSLNESGGSALVPPLPHDELCFPIISKFARNHKSIDPMAKMLAMNRSWREVCDECCDKEREIRLTAKVLDNFSAVLDVMNWHSLFREIYRPWEIIEYPEKCVYVDHSMPNVRYSYDYLCG